MRRAERRVLVLAIVTSAAVHGGTFAQDARKPAVKSAPPQAAQADRPKAAPAANAAAADPNDPRMKQLLAAWEKQSAKLKTLDVAIKRIDNSAAWGNEEFEGRALLESPNHAWLDFNKVDVNGQGKRNLVHHERIICTGTEVWQYRPEVKQVFVFPLDKQNKQRALEEGPLPFLFNMKAAEAEARYVMALVNETKPSYIISVVPRLKVDAEAFSKAFIQLDRASFLPDRILLISPDGTSTKDFTLVKGKVFPNARIPAENFRGFNPGPPWEIVRDVGGNEAVPTGQGVAKRQPPAAPGVVAPRRAAGAPRRPPVN